MKEAGEEVRRARLDLDKLVKAKKQEVRDKHIADAIERIEWDAPVSQRERTFGGELEAVIKGKRVLKSIIKDLKTTVAIINGRISKAKAILDEFEGVHGRELIMDRQSLETKTPDQVEAELRRRLDVKRAEDEKRKAQEEAAKARAEAEAAKAETVKQAQAPKMEGASVIAPSLDDSPFARKPKPQEASDADMDAASEWTVFESAVVMAFGPIKSAKANLKHPSNVERATKFASAVNAAWHAAKEGGAQ
ncbi:hypothetical protein HNR46_001613 [Haloferula luteola]|uniref:Uncharacterized protein n=1 Tax=Haloferula luteola TaxID=595692 RepID=A0A840UZ27_9BACT|nr:hypothetical protein [Haloferula luteola]MBB5351377.1 hypothetical protein [Haloferula luteola]